MAETKAYTLEHSTDQKHPTGALIVKDGKVLGRGANKSALTNKTLVAIHSKYCIRRILKIKTGTKYWMCPGCASSALHSEPHAIKDAQKKFGDITGADLYHWGHWWCCQPCWDAMIKAGIKDVYLMEGAYEAFQRKGLIK